MKLGRPVSESKSLFTRICWLYKGSFLLSLKNGIRQWGRRTVRCRHSEFLYSKNDQYKIVILSFFEKQCSEISIDKVYSNLTIKN